MKTSLPQQIALQEEKLFRIQTLKVFQSRMIIWMSQIRLRMTKVQEEKLLPIDLLKLSMCGEIYVCKKFEI